ncbi:hypothetical protein Tco_0850780 [Tanacetum coccineum]
MTRNKAYLAEFQNFNGGPVAFMSSKGQQRSYTKADEKRDGPRKEEQVFMNELERLKRQEKEANEEAEALRKQFEQETEHLVIQEGAARTSGKQLVDVSVPLDHFPVNTLTSKVFSFMVKKGKHFSGKVTPLFATMLVQPTQDEGASSERPSEALPTPSPAPTSEVPYEPQTDSSPAQTSEVPIEHQPDPSPRPSPTTTIPDSIPETSGENLGGHSSSDKSLLGNEGDMTIQGVYDLCLSLCKQVSGQAKEIQALKAQIKKLKKQAKPVIKHHKAYLKSVSLKQRFPRTSFSKKHRVHKESVSKQGRKFAKGESSVQRDPMFDEMPKDIDHMETKNAQSKGRTREMVDEDKEIDERILSTEDVLSTDKEGVSTDFEKVSTDRPIVSTDGSKVSTDRQIEGTDEQNESTEEQIESTDGQRKGTEEGSATQATQTPISTIFGDDETIAKVLLNMSQAKAVSKEKEKGVELKDITFNKALFSPQWRFLFHTINHCLSSKSTSWDQIPTNIATAVICLTSNQKYNFSKLIFDGMLRHLDAKKKFVMYPRFISIFLDKQLANVSVPLDHFPVNTLTSKVFSFMVKKGKHFSGKVTPLFATMLVQPTQDEGAPSERPSEAQPTPSPAPTSEVPNEPQTDSSPAQTSEVPIEQQTDLSPRPSPTPIIPDSIPETSGGNLGGHSSSDKSLSGNEGDMTLQSVYDLCLSLCAQVSDQAKEIQHLKAQITKLKKQAKPVIKHHRAWLKSVSLKQRLTRKSFSKKQRVHKESVSKQGRKFAKGESSVQRDPLFDEIPEDTVDHMETENAQDVGRTREMVDEDKEIDENILSTEDVLSTDKEAVSTDKEKVSTDRPIVSTDGSKVSTDRPIVSTDGSKVSTDRQIEGTEEQIEGTDEQNEGTEEQIEGTDEQNEGTEEQIESTDGQRKGKVRV